MARVRRVLLGLFVGFLVLGAITVEDTGPLSERELRRARQHTPLPAVPTSETNRHADDPAAARLGQFLFFDERLSANGEVSCATCHDPKLGFGDGKQIGVAIAEVDRHTMSLWNVAFNRWQFWDGRADTLWAQALQPFEDPREMGITRVQVLRHIAEDRKLLSAYQRIFGKLPSLLGLPERARPVPKEPKHSDHEAWLTIDEAHRDGLNRAFANVGKSIAAYERLLISRDSPFDEYLRSMKTTEEFSESALRGLKIFIGKGNCRICHSGTNFTDGEFHNTGVPPRGFTAPRDSGRYAGGKLVVADAFNAAGKYSDDRDGPAAERIRSLVNGPEHWGAFKTPSLRSIALSPPYMREGQLATLEEVVRFYSTLEDQVGMGHHQESILVPLNLDDGEVADLVAFLESLTGAPLDASLLVKPNSPLADH